MYHKKKAADLQFIRRTNHEIKSGNGRAAIV